MQKTLEGGKNTEYIIYYDDISVTVSEASKARHEFEAMRTL